MLKKHIYKILFDFTNKEIESKEIRLLIKSYTDTMWQLECRHKN